MTEQTFVTICAEYLIDASLALENEKVVEAIKEKDIQKLKDVLENEF